MYNYGEFIRGFTEYIILSILENQDSYGYEIRKIILSKSDDTFNLTEATLYLSLKRLSKDKYIEPFDWYNEKGVKRIYYKITPKGLKHLNDFRKDAPTILENIKILIIGEKNEKENKKIDCKKSPRTSL